LEKNEIVICDKSEIVSSDSKNLNVIDHSATQAAMMVTLIVIISLNSASHVDHDQMNSTDLTFDGHDIADSAFADQRQQCNQMRDPIRLRAPD
jgi:hypothetical protein